VAGDGMTESELLDLAAGLEAVDAATWFALQDRGETAGETPGDTTGGRAGTGRSPAQRDLQRHRALRTRRWRLRCPKHSRGRVHADRRRRLGLPRRLLRPDRRLRRLGQPDR